MLLRINLAYKSGKQSFAVAIVGKCEEMESGTYFIAKFYCYYLTGSNRERSNIAVTLLQLFGT